MNGYRQAWGRYTPKYLVGGPRKKNLNVRWRKSWFMVKAPRRDGILWNMVSRMQQRKYVDSRKGERNVKKRGGGMNRLRKLLRGKKRGKRNGGKTGVKRIWRRIRS